MHMDVQSCLKNSTHSTDELRQYIYDDHGNLTQSTITDKTNSNAQTVTAYTYDEVGNRTAMTVAGETTGYTYNGLNQLLQVTNSDGTEIIYTYDERGNQISEVNQDVTTEMEYAVTGEMTKLIKTASGEESDTVTFTQENLYDENGIRISRTENGTERNYYYDRGVVVYTTDGGILSGANVLDAEGDTIGTYRDEVYHGYLKDGQASTTNIVKSDGTLIASYDYTDFGETTEITGSVFDNQVCYTGGIYDEETALYYLNARYYDPEIGRFISQDTYRGEIDDPGQWHLYAYCANNPIKYVDTSGHIAVAVIYLGGIALCAIGSVGCYYTTTDQFQKSWQNAMREINKYYQNTSSKAKSSLRNMCGAIAKSYAKIKKKPRYKSRTEKHHIVARRDPRADVAKNLYFKAGHKSINASFNLVSIKTGLHRRLHTNYYYNYVNQEIRTAYGKRGSKKQNVRNAVTRIGNVLKALSNASPV